VSPLSGILPTIGNFCRKYGAHWAYDRHALAANIRRNNITGDRAVGNFSGSAPSVLDGYITEAELARQLNCSVRTVQRLAERGEGPPRTRIGRHIYYHYEHVREWLLEQEQRRKPVGSAYGHTRRQLRRA